MGCGHGGVERHNRLVGPDERCRRGRGRRQSRLGAVADDSRGDCHVIIRGSDYGDNRGRSDSQLELVPLTAFAVLVLVLVLELDEALEL